MGTQSVGHRNQIKELISDSSVRSASDPAMATYKAYVYEAFGRALEQIKLRSDVPFTALEPTRVRIKVASAALNPIDWKLIEHGAKRLPTSPTPDHPFRLSQDVSGEVVEVGSATERLRVGDHVYGMADFSCRGTAAEYVDLEEKFVALKPSKLSFDEAAAVPLAAQTSYQGLVDHGKLQAGQRVLIIGASGGTGMYAVQFAKIIGAHVIATASFRNVDFVKSLGVDEVIDYTKALWHEVLEPHSIDVIYDCGFEPNSWNDVAQKILKKGTGQFVSIGHPVVTLAESPIGATMHDYLASPRAEDLNTIGKFIEDGKVKVTIDSVYPFDKYLEAMERLQTSRARGKVVIHVRDM